LAVDPKQLDIDKLASMDAEELLRSAYDHFGERIAIGTSLQKSGVIMIDMLSRLKIPMRVFFIDTLMNPPETMELLDEVQNKYNISIEIFKPDEKDIESLYKSVGQWAHFLSRNVCCRVRKGLPLQRALKTMDAWITGLRSDQSEHRNENAKRISLVPADGGRAILKINPLLQWTTEEVDKYTKEHKLPYNSLYDYVSEYGEKYWVLGCAPCHIPVQECHGPRVGKFPWEQGRKECGLHEHGHGI